MASGWNLWVWLECIGVVSGCCCKEVYRFPHNIAFPYSACISSFCSSIPSSMFIFFCNIANVTQTTFEIVQKSRSHEHGNIIIIYKHTSRKASMCEAPSDVSWKLRADFVYDNGIVEANLLHV